MIDISTKAKFDAMKDAALPPDVAREYHKRQLDDGTEIEQLRFSDGAEACYRKLPGDQWRKQAGLLL